MEQKIQLLAYNMTLLLLLLLLEQRFPVTSPLSDVVKLLSIGLGVIWLTVDVGNMEGPVSNPAN